MRTLAVVLGLCFAASAHPQEALPVATAPPQIAFDNWRSVRSDETSVEYVASFPSAIQTVYPENNVVPVYAYVPVRGKGPFPCVLVLHYWGAKDLHVEESLAQELNRRGVAAVMIALPYHMQRTPAGFRSGELAVVADTDRLIQTMVQSASDCRRAVDFIASRPEFASDKIGIAGTSLGAVVATLVYGLEPRLKAAAFTLGGVDLAHILWNSTRVVTEREQLRAQGFTESKLRDTLASVEPLRFLAPRHDPNALVIAAKFDGVVPRRSTEELIAALDHPQTVWLASGHYGGIFVEHRLLSTAADFFESKFGGTPYSAPKSIFVPTLRLAAEVASGIGFDLGVGIDIFRSNDDKETFGSFLITPRGPRLFVGRRLDRGLAAGVTFSVKRIGVGLLWSTVF